METHEEGQIQQLVHLAWNDPNTNGLQAAMLPSKVTGEAMLLLLFLNSGIWIKQNLLTMNLSQQEQWHYEEQY